MDVRIDGKMVSVIDSDCQFRPCYQFGFDKGPFTPGVGYTRPETPHRPVCLTRHVHGCPHPNLQAVCEKCGRDVGPVVAADEDGVLPALPAQCPSCGASASTYWLGVLPDPLPCCANPDVPVVRTRNRTPLSQRCRSCGARLYGKRLELARVASGADPV